MKRETALSIANYLPNIKAIEDYVEDRILEVYKMMEDASPDQIPRLQGSIFELRRLLTMKDRAKAVLDQEIYNGRKEGNPKTSKR